MIKKDPATIYRIYMNQQLSAVMEKLKAMFCQTQNNVIRKALIKMSDDIKNDVEIDLSVLSAEYKGKNIKLANYASRSGDGLDYCADNIDVTKTNLVKVAIIRLYYGEGI